MQALEAAGHSAPRQEEGKDGFTFVFSMLSPFPGIQHSISENDAIHRRELFPAQLT